MGSIQAALGLQADVDDEEQEQQELERWRPQSVEAAHAAIKRKRAASSKSSDSSDSGSAKGGGSADSESVASSVRDDARGAESDDDEAGGDEGDKKSGGSKEDDDEDEEGSDAERDAEALAKKGDAGKRKKKIVVRMEFEPLLALHEPLSVTVEEPAEIFSHTKKKKGQMTAAERAAIEDGATELRKAKEAVHWMAEQGLSEVNIKELGVNLSEDPDELRYALEQSGRFEVDEDGLVTKTLLQTILDNMTNEIEAVDEVLLRLDGVDTTMLEQAVANSGGQLRIKSANGVALLESVDPELEERLQQDEERDKKAQAKAERLKNKGKRKKGHQEEDELSSSDDEEGGEAEKKALAFRRVQVQRKIEEFLKAYTKGMNLVKINAKGKRYHRRVYVDTTKRALVVQGASGPKFFPFASMREVDIETRTTKEGRVETLVICAIEKGGRITKELKLSFPDQAKANTFVNCVTLFSTALRNQGAKHR